jgi:polyphosphate kinase 2 (PPK2 family)
MSQVNIIEKILVDDGIKIIKLWFSIDIEEQKVRLDKRRTNPLHQWKLSTVDTVAQQKFHEYTRYKLKMFERTSTDYSPWIVVNGNSKLTARIEALRYVVSQYDYPLKGETGVSMEVDPNIIAVLKSKEDAKLLLNHYEKSKTERNDLEEEN